MRKHGEIAAVMAEKMRAENISTVMWGDGILVDVARDLKFEGHPLDVMIPICAALRRSALFEHFKVHGHDSRGRSRIVSCFKLK